jgi:hypothetical protein
MTYSGGWLLRILTPGLLLAAAASAGAQQAPKSPAEQTPAAPAATTQPAAPPTEHSGEGPRGGRGMMMGNGNAGQITEITGDTFTLKTQMGATLTVKTTAETRFLGKDRTPAALKDLKVGDYVAAAGPVTEGVVQARFVAELDEAQVKRMEEFKANLGKTVIAGEVKEINETKLTILRPDGQTQVIELDESTSLRRGREESITLADIKPGDRVFGNGELKNGVFVPKELRVMGAGMRRVREPGAPASEPPAPPK